MESDTINRNGSGRPKLDNSTEIDLFETVRKDRSIPIRGIVAAKNISFGRVWRVLSNSNMQLRFIRTQPMLTSTHMQQCLEFCRVNSWNDWIDIDEKSFHLVNLKRKERYHDDSPKNKVRLISKQNTK